ncbi:MAG: D-aminoacyl-tRNA deacylase [Nanoarchaeota archaeon]
MRFAIAYSKLNSAGINIVERLKEMSFTPQIPIIELSKETIYSEDISEKKYPELRGIDFLIFASTHRSERGNPSLSLHAPGNWRNADLGGRPGKICKTSAFVLKYLFQELNKNYEKDKEKLNEEYQITLEVTHHGPLIEIPCCFIELGSSEKQWQDKEAAKIIAKTIISLQNYPNTHIDYWKAAIGIGGGHYNQAANKIMLRTNYAVGHIIPKYSLPLTEYMLKEAESKTQEQISTILLDWKGLGQYKQDTINLLEKIGLKYKRIQNILKED